MPLIIIIISSIIIITCNELKSNRYSRILSLNILPPPPYWNLPLLDDTLIICTPSAFCSFACCTKTPTNCSVVNCLLSWTVYNCNLSNTECINCFGCNSSVLFLFLPYSYTQSCVKCTVLSVVRSAPARSRVYQQQCTEAVVSRQNWLASH